jgi:two-component system, cell cycle response regulator
MHQRSAEYPAEVLIASSDEWMARSIETILDPNQVTVVQALNGRQALSIARLHQPDAILIQSRLPDMDPLELCRTLRADPTLDPHTPIIVASVTPSTRRERVEALRAGAWDYCEISPDTEELLLRLDTYVRAKAASDQLRHASLLDHLTGLYNLQGLTRRLEEAASEARRYRRPLACLAISHDTAADAASPDLVKRTERVAKMVSETCRASDAIGRLRNNKFVVIAVETAPEGAQRLAERMIKAADQVRTELGVGHSELDVRVGFFAVPDFTSAAIRPTEMIARATAALQQQRSTGPQPIVSFGARDA